jgi:ABC-2 type transport system ATP-binding protein
MITINKLNKSYGENKILKDINLSFTKGEVAGLVGENGAGKTTLFKCIAGLESFDGSIEYNEGILRNTLGFLPTNPYFMSKITGREYLQLLCNARSIKVKNLKDINIFDLPLNQYAATYSTGMKKKLALTAILIQQNDVFILDEPFNGVDIQSNILIREVLAKLKASGKIVILSSHIFSTLSETCDILYHLKDGEIIKKANKNEFASIEKEMQESAIGNRLDNLEL